MSKDKVVNFEKEKKKRKKDHNGISEVDRKRALKKILDEAKKLDW